MIYTRNPFAYLAEAVSAVRSAGAVVAAIETDRRPGERDLRRLGIDPKAFLSLGHG